MSDVSSLLCVSDVSSLLCVHAQATQVSMMQQAAVFGAEDKVHLAAS